MTDSKKAEMAGLGLLDLEHGATFARNEADKKEYGGDLLGTEMDIELEKLLMRHIREQVGNDEIVDQYLVNGLRSENGRWSYLAFITGWSFVDLVWQRWEEGSMEPRELFPEELRENKEAWCLVDMKKFNETIEREGGGYGWNAAQVVAHVVNICDGNSQLKHEDFYEMLKLLTKEHLDPAACSTYMEVGGEGYIEFEHEGKTHTFIIYDEAGQESIFAMVTKQ